MSRTTCPHCGKSSANTQALKEYRYVESGLPNVMLRGGVTQTTCADCGEKSIKVFKEGQLLQVLAMKLLMKSGSLTGPEMRFLRGACQMSQAALAKELRHRRETVAEREAKSSPKLAVAEEILLRIILLKSFRTHLERGSNLLSANHRKHLDTFTTTFIDVTKTVIMAATTRGQKAMTATMSKEWRLDEMDAAA